MRLPDTAKTLRYSAAALGAAVALAPATALGGGYPTAPAGMKATFAFGLKRDDAGARRALAARSTVGNPAFRQWMSLSQVTSQFGATSATRKSVTKWFTQRGFTVRMRGANTVALVTGTAGAWTKMTGLRIEWLPNEDGKDIPGSALEAKGTWKLPRALKGLITQQMLVSNSSRLFRGTANENVARETAGTNPDFPAGAPANTGTWAGGCPDAEMGNSNYSMTQLATAYGIPQDAAPTIGIGSLGEGVTTPSLRAAEQCFGWPRTGLRSVPALGASRPYPAPTVIFEDFSEPQLDAQVMRGLLPGASIVDYQVWASADDWWQLPLAVLDDTARPDVVSVSDGVCESYVGATARQMWDSLSVRVGLVGTTLAVSNDDTGAFACGAKPAVAWPASDPWVISVGGTRLVMNAGNTRADEVAWNDYAWLSQEQAGGATGGGISRFYAKPAWQVTPNAAPYSKRLTPDVSAHASRLPGFPVILKTPSKPAVFTWNSGNSAATPVVAVQVAVAALRQKQAGKPSLGFVSPYLYAMAAATPAAFHDITKGDNSVPTYKAPGYQATPGFDLVTGLGVLTPAAPWGG